jgi:hypothetical protein
MNKEEKEDIKRLKEVLIYLGKKIEIGAVEPLL